MEGGARGNRVSNPTSFAAAVRGSEVVTPEVRRTEERKLVRISFGFDGGERGWQKIQSHLELAKKWFVNCSTPAGKACLNWEDEESVMEVEVSELVALQGPSAAKEPDSLHSGEERTGDVLVEEGQFSSDQWYSWRTAFEI